MSGDAFIAAVAAVPASALIWAGLLKLWHPAPASAALVRFGLVRRVRPAFGRLAGCLEIAAGAGLIVSPLRPAAYILPLSLFLLFTGLIVRALLRDENFSCACFGASSDNLSSRTLARTAALLASTLFAFGMSIRTGASAVSATSELRIASTVVLALAIVVLAATIRSTRPFAD